MHPIGPIGTGPMGPIEDAYRWDRLRVHPDWTRLELIPDWTRLEHTPDGPDWNMHPVWPDWSDPIGPDWLKVGSLRAQ